MKKRKIDVENKPKGNFIKASKSVVVFKERGMKVATKWKDCITGDKQRRRELTERVKRKERRMR